MISKPLFKQSCKANAGIWSFVTVITCFMLAIIIMVLGNLNVNGIRESMTDMFVSDAIESQLDKQSTTYFNMTSNALSSYDQNYNDLKNLLQNQFSNEQKMQITTSYSMLVASGKTDEEAKNIIIEGKDESTEKGIITLIDYYKTKTDVEGDIYSDIEISKYVLNKVSDAIYDTLSATDVDTAEKGKAFIETAINSYLEYCQTNTDSNSIEFATNYIPNVLSSVLYDTSFEYGGDTISVSDYFEKEELQEKSYNTIMSFRAELSIKEKQLRNEHPEYSEEEINNQLQVYSDSLILEMSKTLIEELPEKVIDGLNEIRGLDVYGLVIGSIFFRIAGLLLPMIFVIMATNNLVAGQVDTGSMAYVLSTPTKRNTVTITQMLYIVTSLFVMFAMTTLTSVIGLAIVNSSEMTIGYGEIILLNLGAFVTMLAISGICFLSSCWFNSSKQSMSCGGGLTMFFLVATILGLFGSKVIPSAIRIDAMKYFNYVSIISLFDAISILEGTTAFIWKWAILIAIAIVTYTIGIIKFNKKDLPL